MHPISSKYTMRMIGLLGRAQTGKDTAASILSKTLACPIERLSHPLKNAARELFRFTDDQLHGPGKELRDPRYNTRPRECLNWLADATKREFSSDFFTTALLQRTSQSTMNCGYIIPDVRFPEDIECIRQRGGVIIKLSRTITPVSYRFEDHIDALDGDIHILNDGSIDTLQKDLLKALGQWDRRARQRGGGGGGHERRRGWGDRDYLRRRFGDSDS